MFGSAFGNILAILVFFSYQLIGVLITRIILQEEKKDYQILIGSVIGSFSLHWLPTIYSFLLGFNQFSNIMAIVTFLIIGIVIVFVGRTKKGFFNKGKAEISVKRLDHGNYGIWLLIIPAFVYFFIVLYTHTIQMKDGSMYTGQTTYGDMNMHLGFITSIANQGTFPPDYSILPGNKLSYPFLCDSISSSLYVFGASLRLAYILPMLVAILQVFYGFYIFLYHWFKKYSVAMIGWILFFLCGGFGFIYFLDHILTDPVNFMRIFTEFYETPTNLMDQNIRWVNVIVDMLIPQRATLFGWAMLFPVLSLLYKAVFEEKKYYILAGIIIGGLPMIHTHSFLFMAVVCAAWCLQWLIRNFIWKEKMLDWLLKHVYVIGMLLIIIMECIRFQVSHIRGEIIMAVPLVIFLLLCLVGMYGLIQMYRNHDTIYFLKSWGILILFAIGFSLPQLLIWTFQQAGEGEFLSGRFNWVNTTDPYIWFYIKNIGLVALLIIPAFSKCQKKDLKVIFPGILVWILAEFIQFQPNPYDNNKLLYPAYSLLCGIIAYYIVSILKDKKKEVKIVLATVIFILCSGSAILTMVREVRSEYELYGKNQIEMAKYIEENTSYDAIILTNTRHNNAIAALTGRNIVCGTETFLYFHGLNYQEREANIAKIYENVIDYSFLLEDYEVDYILVGPEERGSYTNLNEDLIEETFILIYQFEDVKLYAVSERAQRKIE